MNEIRKTKKIEKNVVYFHDKTFWERLEGVYNAIKVLLYIKEKEFIFDSDGEWNRSYSEELKK